MTLPLERTWLNQFITAVLVIIGCLFGQQCLAQVPQDEDDSPVTVIKMACGFRYDKSDLCSDDDLRLLVDTPHMSRLKIQGDFTSLGFSYLHKADSLKSISAWSSNLDDECLKELENVRSLSEVYLSGGAYSSKQLETLLVRSPKIDVLQIFGFRIDGSRITYLKLTRREKGRWSIKLYADQVETVRMASSKELSSAIDSIFGD